MLAPWFTLHLCLCAWVTVSSASRQSVLPASLKGISDEVLEVNVGGEVFTALRSTLRSGGGLLECIFSDRWDRNWGRDEDGRVFLDFDPESFRALLSYLHTRRHAPPYRVVTAPRMAPEQMQAFRNMLDYCAMEDVEVANTETTTVVPLVAKALTMGVVDTYGGNLTVQGGVVKSSSSSKGMAVGSAPLLQDGDSRTWSVALGDLAEGLAMPQTVRLGITSVNVEGTAWSAYSTDPTTNAWGDQEVLFEGYTRPCREPWTAFGGWQGWKPLDVAIFKLENVEPWPRLKVYLRRTQKVYKFQLRIGETQLRQARLFLELSGTNFQVAIAEASDEELAEAGYWGL